MGVRAFLLPTQSHHWQHGEGSRLLGMQGFLEMWQGRRQQIFSQPCLLSFLLSARAKSMQCFAERQLWRKAPAKCERFTANKQEGQHTFFPCLFLSFFFLFHLGGRKIGLSKEFLCKGRMCWNATARNPSEKRYRSYIELPAEIIWSRRPERPAGILFHQRLMEASHANVLKAVEN